MSPRRTLPLQVGGTVTTTAGGGAPTPGGANKNIQFNDLGNFGGANGFNWDKTGATYYLTLQPGAVSLGIFQIKGATGNFGQFSITDFTRFYAVQADVNGVREGALSNDPFSLLSGGTAFLSGFPNGNVGIGLASVADPGVRLQVTQTVTPAAGIFHITGPAGTIGQFQITEPSGPATMAWFITPSFGGSFGTTTNHPFTIYANNSNGWISIFQTGGIFIGNNSFQGTDRGAGNLEVLKTVRVIGFTVAGLPAGIEGQISYATNGRKVGEGAGLGTGVPVYFSNGSWRVYSTDVAVAA